MEQLELKHIACYLPYGLQVKYRNTQKVEIITDVYNMPDNDDVKLAMRLSDGEHIWMFKPLLRPLSQLTQEIIHNGEKIVASLEIHKRFGYDIASSWGYRHVKPINYPYHIVELLISWHFDVFGLIDKGLAIEKV